MGSLLGGGAVFTLHTCGKQFGAVHRFIPWCSSNLHIVTEVAKSLEFAPTLQALANRIVEGITGGGMHAYNGLHLRVERDARDWTNIMGGTQAIWDGYVSAMRSLGFNATTPIYVASGMLTYGASCELV